MVQGMQAYMQSTLVLYDEEYTLERLLGLQSMVGQVSAPQGASAPPPLPPRPLSCRRLQPGAAAAQPSRVRRPPPGARGSQAPAQAPAHLLPRLRRRPRRISSSSPTSPT
jgi:hypothetical protein